MKLKKGIGVLLCCFTVMMFSVNGLPTKAAQCTHPAFIVGYDICKESWETDDYHYEIRGKVYECPNCNYSYWENLHTVRSNHSWVTVYDDEGTHLECSKCGRIK